MHNDHTHNVNAITNAVNGLCVVARSFAERPRGISPDLRRQLNTAAGNLEMIALLLTAGKHPGNAAEVALEAARPLTTGLGEINNNVARIKVRRCVAVLQAALVDDPAALEGAAGRLTTLDRALVGCEPY